VDVDGTPAGKTNPQGNLVLTDVEASDHYVHIDCPGKPERTVFATLEAGQQFDMSADSSASGTGASALQLAENRLEVRQLLVQAVNVRGDGRFPEAIGDLRRAVSLDPENPNLHHELATTFLMVGDWESARVELLETLRHDPNDADAHNALGFAYEKLGEIRPALDQYRIATHLDPGDDSYQRHYLEALALLPAEHAHKKRRF
jgi:Flp pilus assembly protein TadD